MSDSETKTENKAETKTVDTAPYLKKKPAEKTSKSNFVIPIILLLVSAIVIVATFYEDEYRSLLAKVNPDSTAISDKSAGAEIKAEEEASTSTTETVELNDKKTAESAANEEQAPATAMASLSAPQAGSDQTAEDSNATATDVMTSETGSDSSQQATDNSIAALQQAQPTTRPARSYSAYSPYPRRPGIQNPAKAHTQEQAQKYNEIMQQRRMAYEKEMQARQEKYEAAKKAYMKRRTEMMAAKNAEFERIEKNRIEAAKKVDELRKQIAELQNEIHQIMQSTRPPQQVNPTIRPVPNR